MAVVIEDPGDYYDKLKGYDAWDFPEDTIPVYWIEKYPYKARSKESAEKLASIRNKIDELCYNIENNKDQWERSTNNQEYLDGVNVFLSLHQEYHHDPHSLPSPFYEIAKRGSPTSRYLLSEISRGTAFDGLNKPKMRYRDKRLPPVGKDANGRALYRDIFLNLNKSDKALKNLVIHELSHSLANHIMYRPDDHHADFQWAEKLITRYWPN
jgi:hypothetical protein